MGGEPKTAMTILAFPASKLPLDILQPLMEGALYKIHESGACLVGGHTIDDETLKLGFSVSGFVKKEEAWVNTGAKEGDVLILTKGLGTGTLTSAFKLRKKSHAEIQAAIESMCLLNRVRDKINGTSVNAATDVTGFGLAGHALQMARASRVSFEITTGKLPIIPVAMDCLEQEILNKAHRTNLQYVESETDYSGVPLPFKWLTVDPQTSGGLLLSVSKTEAADVLKNLKERFSLVSEIGRVIEYKNENRRVVFK
jgi:selenide,water dikinase